MRILFCFIICYACNTAFSQQNKIVSGIITDEETNLPLAYAAVYVSGSTYIGTATNSMGQFILKLTSEMPFDTLIFSCLGYESIKLNILEVTPYKSISLKPVSLELAEVTILAIDAPTLINKAIKNIPENYDITPVLLTTFYQQKEKINYNYTETLPEQYSFKEAIFECNYPGYSLSSKNKAAKPAIKILAWRQETEVRDPKLQAYLEVFRDAQANGIMEDDPLRNIKGFMLNQDLYNYTFIGTTTFEDRILYKIHFDQKDIIKEYLYEGEIFIDSATLAFVEITYKGSKKGLKYLNTKEINGTKGYLSKPEGKIKYRSYNNKWNFYFHKKAQTMSMTFTKSGPFKKLFEKYPDADSLSFDFMFNYTLVVTEIDRLNVKNFSAQEKFNPATQLRKEIQAKDEELWGRYNYIKFNDFFDN